MSHNTIPSAQPPARRNQLDVLEDIASGIGELVDAGPGGGGSDGPDKELITLSYTANKAFTGASQGDLITGTVVVNVSGASPVIESSVWYNQTTRLNLASAPLAADIDLAGGGGGASNAQLVAALATQTTSLKDGTLATAAKQDTGNTTLASLDSKATTRNAALASIDTKVTGVATDANLTAQVGTKTTGSTALPAGGTGILGWLSNLWQSFFGVAHAATDAGNPVKVGGRYNSAATSLTNGQRSDLLMNVDGAVLVSMAGSSNAGDGMANVLTQLFRSRTGTDVIPIFGNMLYDSIGLAWNRQRGTTARGALVDTRSTVQVISLQNGALGTGPGAAVSAPCGTKTFQAYGIVGSGTGTATVNIEGSLDNSRWDVIGTLNVNLATTSTSGDSFTSNDRYAFIRSNITATTGSSPSVSVNMGV